MLIVKKGRKQEDLDFQDRLFKLKLPGQEQWLTLFSAAHSPVSMLGSPKAQLSCVTA